MLLAAFVAIESRSKAPLIRLGIFRTRSLTSANVAMLFVMSGLMAMFYFASIYVQEILGWSPLKAGAAFLPVTAGIVVGAGLAQGLVRALGVRVVPVIGIAMAAAGLVLLSGIPTHGTYLANLLPGLAVMSVGMGLTFVPITLIATTGLADEDAGLASGLFNTAQQVGGALGLAALSSIAASRTHNVHGVSHAASLVDGFQLAFLTGAGLMAVAIVVIVVTLRGHHVSAVATGEAADGSRLVVVETHLRSDAQRNLERILEAARSVFAERGLDASVSDVAALAGVGTATIFRRFPTKDDLLAAVLEAELNGLLAQAEKATTLSELMTSMLERFISARCICEAVGSELFERPDVAALKARIGDALTQLLEQEKQAGTIRADVTLEDVEFLFNALGQAGLQAEKASPGTWRRYVDIVLAGLR